MRIKEGFPNQRLVVFPKSLVERSQKMPLVDLLHITDIGAFPSASYHYVDRDPGVSQAIMIGCYSGAGWLNLGDREISIAKGHVLFIPPGTPHIYRADQAQPWSIFWSHFGGLQVPSVFEALGVSKQQPCVFVPDIEQVKSTFESVYACINLGHTDAGLLAMSAEFLRLIGIIKLLQGRGHGRTLSSDARVEKTIAFMRENLNMLFKLKDLAAHSGQSASYFSKVFRQKTGQSPIAYFNQLKIQKACTLLHESEMPVAEIASQLGYEDPYYFSRLFKSIQGRSPSSYRKMLKG